MFHRHNELTLNTQIHFRYWYFFRPCSSVKSDKGSLDDSNSDPRIDDYSSESLSGSIASGSSGFGSLPKKIPAQAASGNNKKLCGTSTN